MKQVTAKTEKTISEMVQDGNKFGYVMDDLFTSMRESCGGYGRVSELKKRGVSIANAGQFNVSKCFAGLYMALSINHPDLIQAVSCLDLSYVNITDFNELVKVVNEDGR